MSIYLSVCVANEGRRPSVRPAATARWLIYGLICGRVNGFMICVEFGYLFCIWLQCGCTYKCISPRSSIFSLVSSHFLQNLLRLSLSFTLCLPRPPPRSWWQRNRDKTAMETSTVGGVGGKGGRIHMPGAKNIPASSQVGGNAFLLFLCQYFVLI